MRFAVAIRFFVCIVCFCLTAAVTGPAAWAQEAESARVISISGEIDGSQAALVQRGISQAEENGDKAIVVRINTQGGRVDSALRIRDLLRETSIPTIALVTSRAWSAGALIAIACRHIVMAPGSSIGAAEPIPATEKNIAALKSEFSTTAADNGHNPRIVEAMVDKKDGLPGYADAGEILALTDVQARELNLSEGTADTAEEVLHLFSLDDATVYYEDRNWKDETLGMLQNEYVRMLFVGLILAAVLIEIKTAGIGVGLVTACLLGGVMLISGDGTLADDLKVIGAFIGGLVLIALELVTPGIGIFGVAGILLLFGSLFWMLGATVQALYILAGGIVIAVILFYILGRHLPKSRLFAKVALTTRSTKEKGYTSQEDKSKYLFQRGTTITILRPAGTIRIGKERVDAVSSGGFIDRDVAVRVIKVEGARVVVEPVPPGP